MGSIAERLSSGWIDGLDMAMKTRGQDDVVGWIAAVLSLVCIDWNYHRRRSTRKLLCGLPEGVLDLDSFVGKFLVGHGREPRAIAVEVFPVFFVA